MYQNDSYKINDNSIKIEFDSNSVKKMTADTRFPGLSEENPHFSIEINSFYQNDAISMQNYVISQILKPSMGDIPTYSQAAYEWDCRYFITYNKIPLISLYTDQYQYMGGAHGITMRKAQSWNVETSEPVLLSQFFNGSENWERLVKEEIIRQIEEKEKQYPGSYFENYAELVWQNFKPENFYIEEEPISVTIFFQQYDIAPYAAGIQTFPIPIKESQI